MNWRAFTAAGAVGVVVFAALVAIVLVAAHQVAHEFAPHLPELSRLHLQRVLDCHVVHGDASCSAHYVMTRLHHLLIP